MSYQSFATLVAVVLVASTLFFCLIKDQWWCRQAREACNAGKVCRNTLVAVTLSNVSSWVATTVGVTLAYPLISAIIVDARDDLAKSLGLCGGIIAFICGIEALDAWVEDRKVFGVTEGDASPFCTPPRTPPLSRDASPEPAVRRSPPKVVHFAELPVSDRKKHSLLYRKLRQLRRR